MLIQRCKEMKNFRLFSKKMMIFIGFKSKQKHGKTIFDL